MFDSIMLPYTILPDCSSDELSNVLINDNLALRDLEDVVGYEEVNLYPVVLPLLTKIRTNRGIKPDVVEFKEEEPLIVYIEAPIVLSQSLEFGIIEIMYPTILKEFGHFDESHIEILLVESALLRIESCCGEPGMTVEVIRDNLRRCFGLSKMTTKAEKKLRDKNISQGFSCGYLGFSDIGRLKGTEEVNPVILEDLPVLVQGLLAFEEPAPVIEVREVNPDVLESSSCEEVEEVEEVEKQQLSSGVLNKLGRSLNKKPKKKKKASRFKFSMISLHVPMGSTLIFKDTTGDEYPEITCEILNDSQVMYKGEAMSLSVAADLAFQSLGDKSSARQGPLYWSFKHSRLTVWRVLSESK